MRIRKVIAASAVLGFGLMVGACAERTYQLWENSNEAEGMGFGDNHRQIIAKHVVNPQPASPTSRESALDGDRATLGIQNYKKNKTDTTSGGGGSGVSTKGPKKI